MKECGISNFIFWSDTTGTAGQFLILFPIWRLFLTCLLVRCLQGLKIPATEPAARADSNNRDCGGPEQPLRSQTVPDLTAAAGAGAADASPADWSRHMPSQPSHAAIETPHTIPAVGDSDP